MGSTLSLLPGGSPAPAVLGWEGVEGEEPRTCQWRGSNLLLLHFDSASWDRRGILPVSWARKPRHSLHPPQPPALAQVWPFLGQLRSPRLQPHAGPVITRSPGLGLHIQGYRYHLSKFHIYVFTSVQFRSVAQWCPTLCDLMNLSTPGPTVHHQFPGFTQTQVH